MRFHCHAMIIVKFHLMEAEKEKKIEKHEMPKEKEVKGKKSSQQNEIKEEKPFDFGGLPDRDLKKNLGCG